MAARVCASRPRVGKGRSRAEPAPRGPLFPAAPLRSAGLCLCRLQEAGSRDPGPGVRAGLRARARPPLPVSPGVGGAERGGRRVRTGLLGRPRAQARGCQARDVGEPQTPARRSVAMWRNPSPGAGSQCPGVGESGSPEGEAAGQEGEVGASRSPSLED